MSKRFKLKVKGISDEVDEKSELKAHLIKKHKILVNSVKKKNKPHLIHDFEIEVIIQNYLITRSIQKAAIRSGFDTPSKIKKVRDLFYSSKTFQEKLKVKFLEQFKRVDLDREDILRNWEILSTFDILDYCDWDSRGNIIFKDPKKIPPELRQAITGIKQTKHGVEIKFVDKLKVQEFLARNLGLFNNEDERTPEEIQLNLTREELRKLSEDELKTLKRLQKKMSTDKSDDE